MANNAHPAGAIADALSSVGPQRDEAGLRLILTELRKSVGEAELGRWAEQRWVSGPIGELYRRMVDHEDRVEAERLRRLRYETPNAASDRAEAKRLARQTAHEARLAAKEQRDRASAAKFEEAGQRLTSAVFRKYLATCLADAERSGLKSIDLDAGSLHREVGGYPGPRHRMDLCCAEMRLARRSGDLTLRRPSKRDGAGLLIRFRLPRPAD